MAMPRNRSTRESGFIPAEIPTDLAATGDANAVISMLAGTQRQFHTIPEATDTQHAPGLGFVAEWAFWAGDAA